MVLVAIVYFFMAVENFFWASVFSSYPAGMANDGQELDMTLGYLFVAMGVLAVFFRQLKQSYLSIVVFELLLLLSIAVICIQLNAYPLQPPLDFMTDVVAYKHNSIISAFLISVLAFLTFQRMKNNRYA